MLRSNSLLSRAAYFLCAFGLGGFSNTLDADGASEIFLPDIVSTNGFHESLDYYSASRDYIIFSRANLDYSRSTVYHGWRVDGDWTIEHASFSDSAYDADAAISPAQSRVIFTSTRTSDLTPEENWNIWIAGSEIENGQFNFSAPTPLPFPVNSASAECCAVFISETEFLFASDRNGSWDIFKAVESEDAFTVTLLPGAVNSAYGEWPNQFLGDRGLLIFSSVRPAGYGGDDIYISEKRGDVFQTPVLLPEPVNSNNFEDNALIENGRLFWSSRRRLVETGSEDSDIYYTSANLIGEAPNHNPRSE